MPTYASSQEVVMGARNSIARPSRRTSATRLVFGLVIVASIAGTSLAQAAASRNGLASAGPWINRTLSGGVARSLSVKELVAVNRARGISSPSR